MMATTFRCNIVTPTESVLDDEITYASVPAWDGQLGVMTGQSPLLTKLGYGSLRLDFPEGGSRWFLLDGGFAQVQDGELTLITDQANPAETLSIEEAEAELAEANARITTPGEDQEKVVKDQQRAMAKKVLAKETQSRGRAI